MPRHVVCVALPADLTAYFDCIFADCGFKHDELIVGVQVNHSLGETVVWQEIEEILENK